jgi:hypothetical protein
MFVDDKRIFRRSELRATVTALARVDEPLAGVIAAVLAEEPLPKPPSITNGDDDDHYSLTISTDVARLVASALLDLEAAAVSSTGEATGLAAYYSELIDRWSRYA